VTTDLWFERNAKRDNGPEEHRVVEVKRFSGGELTLSDHRLKFIKDFS